MSFLVRADTFPPFVCRYVARKRHGTLPMSNRDLAIASGLSRSWIAVLSRRRSWRGIPIDVVDKFSTACGVNFQNPKRATEFLRDSKRHHLVGASAQQRRFIFSLFNKPR